MFEKVKNLFNGKGSNGMDDTYYEKITDHPRIAVSEEEYNRIEENKRIYKNNYDNVLYWASQGEWVEREFRSLNVPKVIAHKLAKLVFNEGCSIKMENKEDDAFLQEIFSMNKFKMIFGEQLESGYGISGLVLRPYFDPKQRKIKISYVQADSFFPLQSSGASIISEAAIRKRTIEVEEKKEVYYSLLEFHEWIDGRYFIRNELYRAKEPTALGKKVDLNTLERYENLSAVTLMKGYTRPLFVYIKMAGKNNADLNSPLSLGIVDNSKRQIKDINEKYDQFMWEIEEAKRKIIASDQFFKTKFDSQGRPIRVFDNKTAVFQRLKSTDPQIMEFVPQLRADEFIQSIDFILRIIEFQTGFSAGTFSFDGKSIKTATEVISENSETFSTRSDNVLLVTEALKELVHTIFEIADANDLYDFPKKLEINIDFDDGVFQSQEEKLAYYGGATQRQLMPKLEAIQKWADVSKETAQKWLNQMNLEARGLSQEEYDAQNRRNLFGSEE